MFVRQIGMRDGMTGEFELVPKDQAKVSVFDSCFLLGDGLWEGIRANRGSIQFAKVGIARFIRFKVLRLMMLQDHIDRLFEASMAMAMDLAMCLNPLLCIRFVY